MAKKSKHLKKFKYVSSGPSAEALPDVVIKANYNKAKVVPKFLGKSKGTSLSDASTNTTSLSRSDFARSASTINDVVANLVRTSPDLSQAVATKISSCISRNYTVIAYDETGRVDVAGTETMQSFCLRLDKSAPDYTRFYRATDFRSLSSSLLLDSLRFGAMAAELVLGATRVPSTIKAFSSMAVKWEDGGDTSYPVYAGPDGDIPLNYPTIFYSSAAQDLTTPYAESPMQTAIQPALWDHEFQDHLRRAAHKNLLQRLKIVIDSEKWRRTLPFEVQSDKEAVKAASADTISTLESQIQGLEPQDALVIFDTLDASTISDANRSEDKSIDILNGLISGQLASGSKILPSIIGRGESASTASTEAMLFIKAVSYTQLELNTFFSRILTLAARLFGHEVYVEFTYADVNLRPELELESFKAVRQSSLKEQLSLGVISDIAFSIAVTGSLPPAGYVDKSGTMFMKEGVETAGNDYSNTSVGASSKTNSSQSTKETQAGSAGVKSK